MLVHNSDTTILDANNAAGELLGYKREDIIGLRISDFTEIHRPMSERNKAEPMIQGHTIFDRVVVRKDGTSIPVEVSNTIMIDNGEN